MGRPDGEGDASMHPSGRRLSTEERLDMAERDILAHARSLTVFTKELSGGFNDRQMAQLREVVHDAFADVGLRIDDPNHIDDAREDFRFLRRLRKNWDDTAKRIGGIVLTAGVGLAVLIFGAGFWAWLNSRGHP